MFRINKLLMIIVLSAFLTWLPKIAHAQAVVSINPQNTTISQGQLINLKVRLDNATNVFGAAFHLNFNPTLLQFVGAGNSGFLSQDGVQIDLLTAVNPPGRLIFGASRTVVSGVSGSGDVANLTFRSLATDGQSTLTFSSNYLQDPNLNSLASNWQGAVINIVSPDTTPPGTPSILFAIPVSANEIQLNWSKVSDNIGVAGYRVYRNGILATTTSSQIDYFNDTGLQPQTTYTYTVSAFDAAGNVSNLSAPNTKTTLAPPDIQAPSIPTGLTATALSPTEIRLNWNQSTDNVGVLIYGVYRNGQLIDGIYGATNTSFTDFNLTPDTTYTYQVDAGDTSYNKSALSAPVSATTEHLPDTTAPSVPTGLTVVSATASRINLAWNASTDPASATQETSGLAGYKVYRDGIYMMAVNSPAYYNDNLSPDTSYSYQVSAIDNAGNESARSASVTATTQTLPDTSAPSIPAGLTATAISPTEIRLNWNQSTDNVGVMSYILYRDGSFIGGNFGVANTTFVDTNLDPNITYSYNVSARDDSSNESARSNPVSATTFKLPDTTTPTVPTNLRLVSATASQLNFAWNSSTDDVAVTGYKVYRNDVYMMTVVTPAYYNAGLPSATSYNYQVSAVDAAGNESARTAALSATTLTITQTDKTAPTVPTGLRASLANATTVNLSWYAANDYASGGVAASGVAGYRIYRNNSWLANVSTTNYSDNTLVKSTNYVYQVISYDRAGNESAKSNAVQVATLGADRTKPNAPGYLKKKNSTSSSIEIGWNAATDPSGYLTPASGVVGYKIYRSGIYLATVGTLSYDDENLMPQTSFRYQVSALDGAGNESALSSVLTASTDLPPDTAAPTVPTNLRFSYDLYYHPTEARLYWSGSRDNRSGRLKYNIYRNDDFIASTTGTSYYQKLNDYGLYQYQIKAIDVTGNESAGSNMVAVNYLKDTTAPGAPANLIVKYNLYYYPKDVRLYWSHSHDDRPGRLKYNIYRNDDFIASTTNTSYFQKLTGYGSYQYQIKAVDKTGNESVGSNLVAIDYLPDTTAPITPAKFYVTQNSHDKSIVKISWYGVRDERPGAVKYNIYRNGDKIITIRSTYVYLRLPMKGSYQYQVTAVDVAGNESAKTAAVTIVW